MVQALQLALAEIPGDYHVSRFDLTAKKAKNTSNETASEEAPGAETANGSETLNAEPDPTDRPIRALIIDQLDAIMNTNSQARHRLLKEAKWAQCPVAVLVPPPTGWIEASKERSQWIEELESLEIELIDELEILTHQFAINFEFWTGYEAPLDSIRESLEEYLQW